ncbi:hypothetical protein HDA36_002510 [Nocardiopsis composta]|uniref:Uncharacterized protein n=1 Tax=Nocardiopsis composta TaxID=157465 RepID=A0A7W8QN00_9ACTN|nr:hypothetical protein [Nocardiopsis composta]
MDRITAAAADPATPLPDELDAAAELLESACAGAEKPLPG